MCFMSVVVILSQTTGNHPVADLFFDNDSTVYMVVNHVFELSYLSPRSTKHDCEETCSGTEESSAQLKKVYD